MNKNKLIIVLIVILALIINLLPVHAVDLESAFGTLTDLDKSSKTLKKNRDILGKASYKITVNFTDQEVCDLTRCIAGAIGQSVIASINFRGEKRGGIYPATVNNLSQGVSNFDGVAVNNRSGGIGFSVPYVSSDSHSVYDLVASCGGRFLSGKRRIEGTCVTEYTPAQGILVTHRGSFSGFKQ